MSKGTEFLKMRLDRFKYMFKHKHNMGFKTLTIKEEVYEKLVKIKPKEESFSEFLGEFAETRQKKDIMKFAGAWKMPDEEYKKVKGYIKEYRKAFDKSFRARVKKLGLDKK